jgi:hypothetical protein
MGKTILKPTMSNIDEKINNSLKRFSPKYRIIRKMEPAIIRIPIQYSTGMMLKTKNGPEPICSILIGKTEKNARANARVTVETRKAGLFTILLIDSN